GQRHQPRGGNAEREFFAGLGSGGGGLCNRADLRLEALGLRALLKAGLDSGFYLRPVSVAVKKSVRRVDLVLEPKLARKLDRPCGLLGLLRGDQPALPFQRIEAVPNLNGRAVNLVDLGCERLDRGEPVGLRAILKKINVHKSPLRSSNFEVRVMY